MSKVYVGIDVGKTELWVAVRGSKARRFAHTVRGQTSLVRWLTRWGAVQVCMEATGIYSRRLALRLLREPELTVSIINPSQIKAFRQVLLCRTKTDAVDAEVILAYAESQQPLCWQPGSQAQEQLAALVKQADRLGRLLRQSQARKEHSDAVPTVVRASERALQRCLAQQLAAVEAAIDDLCATSELQRHVTLLATIPGIGVRAARQLLCYGGTALFDHSQKELTAHAGLAAQHHLSGTSVRGRSRLNKQGNRRLRTALYMPTLVAVRANPRLKTFYEHLLARGKAKKLALIACMRKLLAIVRAMLQTNTPFDPALGLT